eukprot:CAMPEP_0174845952 /NCGR_PEP_ID=MMETSP1114-20130205/12037_1 /TAXON_ID=312471 /ORGANISM="Neobodo designis, Strain CCAP 1951/1" /LENGTH=145 /DNA_ID=CAMNT_0016080209 /DNA_START=82 /DNA_END=515 /DNA_ORIENTATION=+
MRERVTCTSKGNASSHRREAIEKSTQSHVKKDVENVLKETREARKEQEQEISHHTVAMWTRSVPLPLAVTSTLATGMRTGGSGSPSGVSTGSSRQPPARPSTNSAREAKNGPVTARCDAVSTPSQLSRLAMPAAVMAREATFTES